MTVSLVAVFIPVLFLGGILGRLFREFAVTISVAILISGFVSLSLTPMLCSRLLKTIRHSNSPEQDDAGQAFPADAEEKRARPDAGTPALSRKAKWWSITERAYDSLAGGYRRTLEIVLEHRALTVLISLVLFGVTIVLFYVIPKGFIPTDDTSQIVGYTEAVEGISFPEMSRHQEQLVRLSIQS